MSTRDGEATVGFTRDQRSDAATLRRHFGVSDGLLSLWMAEPGVELAPAVCRALEARAGAGWYGYELRPPSIVDAFWEWMSARHQWDGSGLDAAVSPSIGTSVAVLIDLVTDVGDGVIIQPPVFTDFKTLITASGRTVIRNPLSSTGDGYRIDFDGLAAKAADPANRMLILCSPHNPVGRVWRLEELSRLASICAENGVFVLADEIHADITLPPHAFVPFAAAAGPAADLEWAATHGPLKTFGLAGVCDTLLVGNAAVVDAFHEVSSQFHLTRNNVFGLVAFETAYRHGASWLDELLESLARNISILEQRLPEQITLAATEGTYLAWLDLRQLGLEVPDLPRWLASSAGLALSPGHWFGREGAGFARMSIAEPADIIERAAEQLAAAVTNLTPDNS